MTKELSDEKRTLMSDEIRRLKGIGFPELAAPISVALSEGEYFMGEGVPVGAEEIIPPPRGAKKEFWVAYAISVSDIDVEVIKSATRKDIIGMLRANSIDVVPKKVDGKLRKPAPVDGGDDDDGDDDDGDDE